MKLPVTYFCLILLLQMISLSIAKADDLSSAIEALPSIVEDIRVMGSWKNNDESGVYRVIFIGQDKNQSGRLFIQWIVENEGHTKRHVKASIEITEFAELDAHMTDYRFDADPDGLVLFIDMKMPTSDIIETYELFIISSEHYNFGPMTN